jgi:hypothetical protein
MEVIMYLIVELVSEVSLFLIINTLQGIIKMASDNTNAGDNSSSLINVGWVWESA